MIRAENIIKSFSDGERKLTVLKGISFEVLSGEFVSIIGRSGSGKSTLMYQLGLLDFPDSGQVFIDGKEVTHLNGVERARMRLSDLGYVFQDYALIPELTAAEQVMTPLIMLGLTKAEARKDAENALDRLGLSGRYDNLPSQLSGGEQQRVSIARAISHEPKIIFADEPTANLDSDTARVVLKAFVELNREGQTIVMVTHEPEYAALTDRIITLSDGEIIGDKKVKKK